MANICWIIELAKKFQKNIYFCFIDYAKAFDYMDHNKVWKILQEMGIPEHLTCTWETSMQVRKQQLEPDMEQVNNQFFQNWVRSVSRLYIVIMSI